MSAHKGHNVCRLLVVQTHPFPPPAACAPTYVHTHAHTYTCTHAHAHAHTDTPAILEQAACTMKASSLVSALESMPSPAPWRRATGKLRASCLHIVSPTSFGLRIIAGNGNWLVGLHSLVRGSDRPDGSRMGEWESKITLKRRAYTRTHTLTNTYSHAHTHTHTHTSQLAFNQISCSRPAEARIANIRHRR